MTRRVNGLEKAKTIRKHFAQVKESPLLNFIDFMFEAIDEENFELLKQMANEDY